MLLLSTLVACIHLGLLPVGDSDGADAHGVFGRVDVSAPVAEPGVDEALGAALSLALAARHALAEGPPLVVTITEATMNPALRGDPSGPGGGLWYRARLVAHVDTPAASRTFILEDWAPETGAVPDRARVFAALSDRLSQQIAAWAVSGGSGSSGAPMPPSPPPPAPP